MKFSIKTILSMSVDEASSHLIIFGNTTRVLLDCGIGPKFDFKKYMDHKDELKNVCLVLVSHSNLRYSGALCFLINELQLNPKIFYTTQPIMRYSPLNMHEAIQCLQCTSYNKKVFNKIYKIYESINIIKPEQKKKLDLDQKNLVVEQMKNQEQEYVGQVEKVIYFTCYCAGSSMCNLAWRLSFGIVDVLYLVEFNNYSRYHIEGIDLAQILQPTDILITDPCENVDDGEIKKDNLYESLKDAIINFYEQNRIPLQRPPPITNLESQSRLLITCQPGQMLIQIMAVVKKILQQLQTKENKQNIRVINLSSRFLQLVKSQIEYFTPDFKQTLQNIEISFLHSKTISGRINITTLAALNTLLLDQITKSIQIIHVGPLQSENKLAMIREKGLENLSVLHLFLPDDKLQHSASKMEEENEQGQQQQQQLRNTSNNDRDKDDRSEIQDETQMRDVQKSQLEQEQEQQYQNTNNQLIHGHYLSKIGFPHFVKKPREQDHNFDEYGIRHQYARFKQNKTIEEYNQEKEGNRIVLNKKNSTIEVMNIEFKTYDKSDVNLCLNWQKILQIQNNRTKTNYNSSKQILLALKAKYLIFINSKSTPRNTDPLISKYKAELAQIIASHNIQDLSSKIKNQCYLTVNNELISLKVNYIPIPPDQKLQKVKGIINYSSNGLLCIHLQCLDQKELLDFRLDLLYCRFREQKLNCSFTKHGICIQGINIYRQGKNIILSGNYSENYFKVRRLLYDFLQID